MTTPRAAPARRKRPTNHPASHGLTCRSPRMGSAARTKPTPTSPGPHRPLRDHRHPGPPHDHKPAHHRPGPSATAHPASDARLAHLRPVRRPPAARIRLAWSVLGRPLVSEWEGQVVGRRWHPTPAHPASGGRFACPNPVRRSAGGRVRLVRSVRGRALVSGWAGQVVGGRWHATPAHPGSGGRPACLNPVRRSAGGRVRLVRGYVLGSGRLGQVAGGRWRPGLVSSLICLPLSLVHRSSGDRGGGWWSVGEWGLEPGHAGQVVGEWLCAGPPRHRRPACRRPGPVQHSVTARPGRGGCRAACLPQVHRSPRVRLVRVGAGVQGGRSMCASTSVGDLLRTRPAHRSGVVGGE
ncbi:hypothetical protein Actkin_00692 [Actinokineospora sp. UTMC 2448]|nr:hypothetical protein Actkin_00692 [Actinokineospora sp. UTMC 2448]